MKKYTVTADIPEGFGGRIEFLIDRGKGFIPIPGVKGQWWSTWDCHVELEDEETAIVRAVMTITEFPDYYACSGCPNPQIETKDVIVGEQPKIIEFDIPKTHEYGKYTMETEYTDKGPKVNYSHPVEGSQHYTDLAQLLQTMKHLDSRVGFKDHLEETEICPLWLKREVDYIIKGLENSIAAGYKIVDPVPEGYMTIVAPVGGYVVTPNMKIIPITADTFVELGFRFDGICWNHPDGLCIGYYKGGYFHVPQTLANRGEKILYKHQVERLLNEHRK